jgi:hypothetical protein
MDTWTDIVVFLAGFIALDQAGAWLERRGWIRWKGVVAQQGVDE